MARFGGPFRLGSPMASDLQIQGEVVVNSEKAESAFNRVGDKATQMANEVATSAGKAGQAVDKIGDGAGASAEKFTRAESRISASIKRATNELELLGKTASQRLEFNIADKGLDAAKFEPALKKLRELEAQAQAAQRAASGSLDKMGISAAQTAAALRGVPAQFTDIVTSLQGGQAPLTVFLQQGGQLRDMFGDAGAAARALGGYVLGLVNPFTVLAAAAAGVALSYNQGSKENDAFVRSIVTTGNASGVTTSQLRDYARAIDGVVGTQAQAAEGLAAFVAAGVRGGDELRRYTQTAIEWEKATGQAVSKTAEQFASLQKDPLSAVLKLNEGTNFLTTSVYEQIKALTEQGRSADASKVAMDALDAAMRDRGKAIADNLGYIERGWRGIKSAAAEAWDAMLNVGRASTIGDQLAKAQAELDARTAKAGVLGNDAAFERGNEKLRTRISHLKELIAQEGASAKAQEESARAVQARHKWDQAGEQFLSKQVQMERELAKAREEGKAAGASVAEIEERLAGIREKYKDNGAEKAARAHNAELERQRSLLAELAGLSSSFYKDWDTLSKMGLPIAELEKAQADLLAKQPAMVAGAKAEADALKLRVKAYEDEVKAQQKLLDQRQNAASQVEDSLRKAREEEQAHAMAAASGITLAEALAQIALARAEDNYQKALGAGADAETLLALQREIEARKGLIEVMRDRGVREANKRAAEEAAKDWERTAKTISDTLADYIMSGGKDAAQYLKRLFATLVLQPTVQMLVGSVLGTGPAAAASTGSNIMGLANNASSLNTLYGTASQALVGGTAGASMASLGYANAVGMLGGDAIGALATANGMWAGVATGAQAAAQAAVAANTAMAAGTATALEAGTLATAAGAGAGAGAGITSALAAIPGWGWALGGVLALGAIFGGNKSTPHMGGAGSYSAEGGASTGLDVLGQGLTFGVGERYYNSDAEKVAVGISQGIVQMLDSTAQSFGQQAGYFAATAFADDSSKDGAWGSLRIMRGDEKVLDWADTQTSKWAPKEFSDGEAGQKEYAAAIAASARDALKTAVGDADWAKDMLDTLGDSVTLEGLDTVVAQINQAKAAFTSFGQYMPTFAGLAESTVSALVDAAGGVDPLSQGMATFVENFYTDAEKLAINTENVRQAMQELGFEMPETRDEFKALVQAQLALGDAGAKTAAGLLGLSGAFAAVTPAAESAQSSIASVSEQLQDAFGMTADAISGILNDAVTSAQTASEAQRMAAQAFEEQFYGGAMSSLTDSLGAMIQSSVIAPMMESLIAGSAASASLLASGGAVAAGAMASGGAAGGAASAAGGSSAAGAMASGGASAANAMVSGGSAAGAIVASAVEQARAQVNAYTQILSDPAVQAGIKDISKLVGDVAGLTFDAQQSWGGGGGSFAGGGTGSGQAASEADKLAESLKKLGETVEDEIKRLAGLMNDADPQKERAALLAEFAVQTAKAKTGDQAALGELTGLSKAIEQATKLTAASAFDLSATRGWLASSLEGTLKALNLEVPKFDVGTNYVPRTTLAMVHEGEAIVPKAYNPWAGGAGGGQDQTALASEIRALREENRQQAGEIARLNLRMARVLERWDGGGMPAERLETA